MGDLNQPSCRKQAAFLKSVGWRRQRCPKDQSGNSSFYCSALSPAQHSYHIHLLWRKRKIPSPNLTPQIPSTTFLWTLSLHSSGAQRASSINFKLTPNQSQTNFSLAIIIRSSLDANSVSERGLQSKLYMNNYDRILKPALESKRIVESMCLLEGMEGHTEGGNFLPARYGEESPQRPHYKWIWDISSQGWSRTSGCHKRWWLHLSAERSWGGQVSKVMA